MARWRSSRSGSWSSERIWLRFSSSFLPFLSSLKVSDEVISENSRPKALRPVLSFSLMIFSSSSESVCGR